MTDWFTGLLLITVVVLVLIPVVMVGRLVVQVASGFRRHRAAEAQRVTRVVPGLGEFSSTDGEIWSGVVQGLEITVRSWQEAPAGAQAEQVRAILGDLPALTDSGKAYLAAHEDLSWLAGGSAAFEPFGIDIDSEAPLSFTLRLIHAADPDAMYWAKFVDGEPVQSGRDD